MKAGDMVNMPRRAPIREDAAFPNVTTVDIILRKPNNRIGFGAGLHRQGAHQARCELNTALQEWHKRIPHCCYCVAADAELVETGAQLGLESLALDWHA
jgi:cytochrome P450